MKIRTETPHDTDRVREVITAAFGSPEDAGLVDALRADACWIPALDTARALGEHTVIVLGHPTYYPRFGFERADAHGVTCTLSAGPDEAKMVLSLDGSPIPSGDMTFGKPMAGAISAYQPE
ncbi:hypothetical protein B7P34_19370 [Streptosporangium nondiastaticum]|uniref:GNAT family N-acetyltransferase n=1 Tax=Streptosporangium nondiastaticum TaxID=35764 RepID=A0A9X7PGI8_9ACTN|nr:hypothetical protein [Streptosporangium nondiastaticum]PSJ27099.1 hypothetical protein B7P34_19370 [Streptosporangium nondiastaticum]